MAIIRCPECGHEISDKAPFCPSCGVAIAGKVTTCPQCGKVYFADADQCPQCHCKTVRPKPENVQTQPATEKLPEAEQPGAEPSQTATEQQQDTARPGAENAERASRQEPQKESAEKPIRQPQHEEPAVQAEETEEVKHGSHGNRTIIVAVVAVAAVVIGTCYYFYRSAQADSERQAYEYAMTSRDPQVLQNYLANYEGAPEEHRDSIQAHLDALRQVDQDWTNVLVSGSKSALEQYIAAHPDSPYKAVALHKIDSLDWSLALRQNSVEALEAYIEQHPDGEHVDDANDAIKSLNSKTVQPEEKQTVSSVFGAFFQSLNNRDEDALVATVNPILTNFLGKSGATRNDVITFLHKIYKPEVASMQWQSQGDYSISKKDVGDQTFEYSVKFSALQTVAAADGTTTDAKYRITATVNADGRISELNMTKIVE